MKRDKDVCPKDCPERSAECRLSCDRYKEYSEGKMAEYAKRAKALESVPDSPMKKRHANKNALNKMRGR